MQIIGIDLGFSPTKITSCYCAFKVDKETKEISFLFEPTKFNYRDTRIINMIRSNAFDVITLDAPLTPKHIDETGQAKPKTGRTIEKAFSLGIFNNSQRGPQPSSIAVPKQGWPFYCAGMQFASALNPYRYLSIENIRNGETTGIYEVIPKLTQTLLMPRGVLVKRNDQIDNYLFPLLFQISSPYRQNINNALDGYYFSSEIETYINGISKQIRKYHEELAAFVSAVQALLICIGKASIVGFNGDFEAYYALPNTAFWQREWLDCFNNKSKAKCPNLQVIEKALPPVSKVSNAIFNKPAAKAETVPLIRKNNRKPSTSTKSTTPGYINKNNQKNLGKTDTRGSGNQQWFYQMQCLDCGHLYYANGHDIWLRKCPKCRGGQP